MSWHWIPAAISVPVLGAVLLFAFGALDRIDLHWNWSGGLEIVFLSEPAPGEVVARGPVYIEYDVPKQVLPGAQGGGANATLNKRALVYPVVRSVLGLLPVTLSVAMPLEDVCERDQGYLHFVTNTNDSGSGSLRDILENQLHNDTLDVVILRVGGNIDVSSSIVPSGNCWILFGQTAPGDGLQIRHTAGGEMLEFPRGGESSHAVIAYMKFRSGETTSQDDAVVILGGHHILISHASVSGGNDETLSVTSLSQPVSGGVDIDDVTIEWTIIGPCYRDHSTGTMVDGQSDSTTHVFDVSFYFNFWVNNAHRNPLAGNAYNDSLVVINNVVYNWRNWVCGADNQGHFDYVANYWKPGPWTGFTVGEICRYNGDGPYDDLPHPFMHRNVVVGGTLDSLDNQEVWEEKDTGEPLPSGNYPSSRQMSPKLENQRLSAAAAFQAVMDSVGAHRYLNCDGTWKATDRDRWDLMFVSHALNDSGPASDAENDHEDDYGGLPSLSGGTACDDNDSDGMPNAFEDRFAGLDKNTYDAFGDLDGDGYTNVEEYGRGTTP